MINLSDYIESNSLYFRNIFDGVGKPWAALSRIESYIRKTGSQLLKKEGFKEYERGVYVGKNTSINPNAEVKGPALIGKNSKVGASVVIRGGVIIGEGCNIGHGSEVKHSIVGNSTNIPHFNYVGDSIIGSNVNLAAGVILANWKYGVSDLEVKVLTIKGKVGTGLEKLGAVVGDKVSIGCNSVTDPGSLIGKNTLIYPLTPIRGTIAANKIVKYKPRLEIVDKK